jgi:hypothetical protein
MNWTIKEAQQLCDRLEDVVSRYGFLLSIYGSTVRKGIGRDLDVIIVQKYTYAIPKVVCEAIKLELSASTVGKPEKSMFADHCELLLLPDGRMLDIQVRLSRNRIDALEMYEQYGATYE